MSHYADLFPSHYPCICHFACQMIDYDDDLMAEEDLTLRCFASGGDICEDWSTNQ